jgi:hypothetical protein
VAGRCEHGNEHSACKKRGNIFDCLKKYELFKKDPASCP